MTDLVRVRENGVEHNEGRARAIAKGLEILDEPTHLGGKPRRATRAGGRPVKPKTTVAKSAATRRRKKKTSPPPTPVTEEPQATDDESASDGSKGADGAETGGGLSAPNQGEDR